MTTVSIKAIGFCVNYTEQGDRAFDLAFELASRNRLKLNIFHFLEDPYDPDVVGLDKLEGEDRQHRLIEMERKMRLYYDDRLGDFLDVGFRLCERNEWTELHRCLTKREFQTLVLACPAEDAVFGRKPLLDFVKSFSCPVIVVGPGLDEIRFNTPARLVLDKLSGPDGHQYREISHSVPAI